MAGKAAKAGAKAGGKAGSSKAGSRPPHGGTPEKSGVEKQKEAVRCKANVMKAKATAHTLCDKIQSDLAYKWGNNSENYGELKQKLNPLIAAENSDPTIKDFFLLDTKAFRSQQPNDEVWIQSLNNVCSLQANVDEVARLSKQIMTRHKL